MQAQAKLDCDKLDFNSEKDFFFHDSTTSSIKTIDPLFISNATMVVCPEGIERSSPNDIKKRWGFKWKVRYDNIYFKTSSGLVVEGMNKHGFSASLMLLKNSRLPEKEKELIPIGASLAVNFYIDHFKSIDTALLAVWDTRIFDDMDMECEWPFRIILHDSCGATAYIEHINSRLRVYTPEAPCAITSGADYARLLMLKYMPDSLPANKAEERFLHYDQILPGKNITAFVPEFTNSDVSAQAAVFIKDHTSRSITIIDGRGKRKVIKFSGIEPIPGREISKSIF
ncbi:MAG: hypothetical protein RQ761_04805 [Bacteroidales bacterium]|nr:hypothetical protein [Bacteroidales bacterium]